MVAIGREFIIRVLGRSFHRPFFISQSLSVYTTVALTRETCAFSPVVMTNLSHTQSDKPADRLLAQHCQQCQQSCQCRNLVAGATQSTPQNAETTCQRSALSSMAEMYHLTATCWQDFVEPAVKALHRNGIIAVPTDTIYGIAGLAQSTAAVKTIYKMKRRDPNNPVSICVGDVSDVYRWGKVNISPELLNRLLPGPVTVVFERSDELNPDLNPDIRQVGIRVPDHGFVREIARAAGQPLALTSANLSGQPSPLSVEELNGICTHLEAIFDGGVLGSSPTARLGSTVVDLSTPGHFSIIRPGSAEKSTLESLNAHGLKPLASGR